MLWLLGEGVVVLGESLNNAIAHANVHAFFFAMPIQIISHIQSSFPIFRHFTMFSEGGQQMVCVLSPFMLDSKTIHTKSKGEGAAEVFPQAWRVSDFTMPPFC